MSVILYYSLMLAPGLAVTVSLAAANRKLNLPPGQYFIVLGAGIALAYIFAGATIALLGRNIPYLMHGFITLTSLFGVAAIIGTVYLVFSKRRVDSTIVWIQVFSFVLLIIVHFSWSTQPAQAWDSVDLWLREAGRFVFSQNEDSGIQPYFYSQRHPFTVISLAALSAWGGAVLETTELTLLLWSIAGLSLALVCFGYALYWQIDIRVSALLAYAVIMTPLLENHYLLFGYADIWLAAILVATLAVFDVGIRSQSRSFIILGFLLLISLLLIKNIGIIFVATLLGLGALTFLVAKLSLKIVVAFIVGTCGLLLLSVESGPPKIASVFDVALESSHLDVSRKGCSAASLNDKFLVGIVPENPEDLKPIVSNWVASKYPGRDIRVFRKDFFSVSSPDGSCNFKIDLGTYDKKLIRVGQLSERNHPSWIGILVPEAAQYSIHALGVSVQIGEVFVLSAVGRHMILELSSPAKVGKNFFHAHFVNSSYSLWTLLLLLSTLCYCFGHMRLSVQEAFPLLAAWTFIGVLLSSQIFIIDFFKTSLPVSDTRYSRFILWLPAAVMFTTLPLLRAGGAAGPLAEVRSK